VKFEISTVIGAPGTWHVYLTENNVLSYAYGHHGLENGVPAAWISPTQCGLVAGQSQAEHDQALWGIISPYISFKRLAAVLIEEILEALVDPNLNPGRWAVGPDGEWLIEVCDQANSGYVVMDVATRLNLWSKPVHRKVVLPDATLPSFYKTDGKAPYSYAAALKFPVLAKVPAAIKKPFDHVTGCYAYIKGANGADMSMFARKNDPDDTQPAPVATPKG